MAYVTWVLGAGFSRALGGPLLSDLFTPESSRSAGTFFPSDRYPALHDGFARVAFRLYQHGTPKTHGGGPGLWGNPEEFLETLDTAVQCGPDSVRWREMLRHVDALEPGTAARISQNLRALSAAARRQLAAECSAFLLENDVESEKWLPYHRWARQLDHRDTVITFNYDLVLETLLQDHADLVFQLPRKDISEADREFRRKPLVLKLHGSVDWKKESRSFSRSEPHFALSGPDDQIAIAAPGPSKQAMVREIEDLWKEAALHLQHCSAVVFIGYRFPPTDAEAEYRVLDAIGKNDNKLDVYTVLGPDTGSLDSRRVVALLSHKRARYGHGKVEALPMYAQDFLNVYTRELFSHLD